VNLTATSEPCASDKIILDLCGGTGSWSRPYLEAGYTVHNITLPEFDVRTWQGYRDMKVHGILAAPPCTEFAVSGGRWWAGKDPQLLIDALATVDACLAIIQHCNPLWWVIENPVGRLRRLRKIELGEPVMWFHPCDYGDPYTKKTLLWGRFTPPRKYPIAPAKPDGWNPIHYPRFEGKSHRWGDPKVKEYRSITPTGFARAFSEANP